MPPIITHMDKHVCDWLTVNETIRGGPFGAIFKVAFTIRPPFGAVRVDAAAVKD